MKRVRIPIAALMAVIALLAVELASLRVASDGWVDVTRYLTIAMLVATTSLARSRRREREGAWWFGFALLGWAYFALVLDATARRGFALGINRVPFPDLPPLTLLGLLGDESEAGDDLGLLVLMWNRYEILQSILTLVVACIGGIVCWILAPRRGAPYREEARRAGRLELAEDPER